jgi:hypothetical protein
MGRGLIWGARVHMGGAEPADSAQRRDAGRTVLCLPCKQAGRQTVMQGGRYRADGALLAL